MRIFVTQFLLDPSFQVIERRNQLHALLVDARLKFRSGLYKKLQTVVLVILPNDGISDFGDLFVRKELVREYRNPFLFDESVAVVSFFIEKSMQERDVGVFDGGNTLTQLGR